MTKHTTVRTTDPDFAKHVQAYLERLDQVVKEGRAGELVEQGNLGLLWYKAVPDLPRPMSCPDLELVPVVAEGNIPKGWAFFCHRWGCLCAPMRADLPGEYPEACPEGSIEDEIRWGQPEEEEEGDVQDWDGWEECDWEDYAEDWNPDRDEYDEEETNDEP